MRILKWIFGVHNRLRNSRFPWYKRMKRRDESPITWRILICMWLGFKDRGRPKERWMGCLKDIRICIESHTRRRIIEMNGTR